MRQRIVIHRLVGPLVSGVLLAGCAGSSSNEVLTSDTSVEATTSSSPDVTAARVVPNLDTPTPLLVSVDGVVQQSVRWYSACSSGLCADGAPKPGDYVVEVPGGSQATIAWPSSDELVRVTLVEVGTSESTTTTYARYDAASGSILSRPSDADRADVYVQLAGASYAFRLVWLATESQ